jgi:hypothetical protein
MKIQTLLSAIFLAATTTFIFPHVSMAQTEGEAVVDREPAAKKRRAMDDSEGASGGGGASNQGRSMNIRIAPFSLFNIAFEFKVSDGWSIGPTLLYWRNTYSSTLFTNDEIIGTTKAFGARATWAKNGTFETGLYLAPTFQYAMIEVSGVSRSSGSTIKATSDLPILAGIIGYQFCGEGWNVAVGAGLAASAGSSKMEVKDGTTTQTIENSRIAGFTGELLIGYAF